MKFSYAKKRKMRKRRNKQIRKVFNSLYDPCFLQVINQEEDHDYTVISKLELCEEYFLLCKDEDSNEIVILKLVYTDWVKAVKLSEKKILKREKFLKEWLKKVNFEQRRNMIKYVLRKNGVIEARPTDYIGKRPKPNEITIVIPLLGLN